LAIDGRTLAQEYYRFGAIGRDQTDSLVSMEGRWKRFAVHFDDLPSSLSDLRIGFDVVGEGVVDIGRVELFDRWYDNSEPVPMFRPKVAEASTEKPNELKQNKDTLKAGKSLSR